MRIGSFRDLSAGILVGTFFLAYSLPAEAGVASYRYSLSSRSCGNYGRFAGTVSPSAPYRYEVETDSANRIVRVTRYWNNRALWETRNTAFNTANLPIATTTSESGVTTGRRSTERDSSGCIVRAASYAMSGAKTGSSTYTYSAEYIEGHGFSADDKPLTVSRLYYNADGLLARSVWYSNALDVSQWTDGTIDPSTGMTTESHQYKDYGKTLVSRTVFQYDANDVIVHDDSFDANGRHYVGKDYNDGSLVKKSYTFVDGSTSVVTYTNDAQGYTTAAEESDNGVVHCRFAIERRADGTVMRTVVRAADGTMLAEYPDHLATECYANGTVVGGFQGTIYKSPPWW